MMSAEPPGAGAEVVSLGAVREKNFRFICRVIKEKFSSLDLKTVLDVGSSTGHFLDVAAAEGFSVTGLEPDARLADETRLRGRDVVAGFFPGADGIRGQKYDVVIFNDSLEHIPNIQEALRGIKAHLGEAGLAIVNLPTSDGIIFKASSFLYKLGIKTPFGRLWQTGFASPHVHYFNLRNLRRLFENNGFKLQYSSPLRYYTIKGLWPRISCKSPFLVSFFVWLALILLYPLLRLRSDCFVACFYLPRI
jgi:2-polyprenyl-3-methyl-5-hydroxy-6-metoxy-1,4-benzoquinol methylase